MKKRLVWLMIFLIISLIVSSTFVTNIAFENEARADGKKTEYMPPVHIEGFPKIASRGDIIYVDDDGSKDHQSIQPAVDSANSGDTIFVFPGEYFENNLVIGKTLSLVGSGYGNTFISGDTAGHVITITANWVNISGFKVRYSGKNGDFAGIMVDNSDHCRINDTHCRDNAFNIILKNHSDHNNITNNICGEIGDINSHNGIHVSESKWNHIKNNTFIENSHYGIELSYSCNNTIQNNTCMGSNDAGIRIIHSDNNTVRSNRCLYNYKGVTIVVETSV